MAFISISGENVIRTLSQFLAENARRQFAQPFSGLRKKSALDYETLSKRIILSAPNMSGEESACAAYQDGGLNLARQEDWPRLSDQIRFADDSRRLTPGGEPAATLLAIGARGDVVSSAEDALHEGAKPDPRGIEALEEMLAGMPNDYPCAVTVAMTHIDMGWAWFTNAPSPKAEEYEHRAATHFARAAEILAPFDGVDLDAPSLASAQCALAVVMPQPKADIKDQYEKLIDLDPDCPRHMRTLGKLLLPDHHGNHNRLEQEAHRTAARTESIWGAGAYVWVYLDALAIDRRTLALLDCDFFIQGMRDILARKPDQHVINLLAAFCAISMGSSEGKSRHPAREKNRQSLHQCLDWIVANHLREIHPLVWAQAILSPGLSQHLPSRPALVTKGRLAALQAIADCFADKIADGSAIKFSENGVYRVPAS